MRLVVPVLAAALVVAAGTGCSSDGDGGSDAAGTTTAAPPTTAPSETRPEPPDDQSRWAKQVDEACKPWQAQIDAVAPPANADGLIRWLSDTMPIVRKQVAAVRAVKPPGKESEAKRAELFVGALEKLERGLTRYHAALKAGDSAAIEKALVEANAAGAEARGYAVSLGITQCGGYASG